MTLTEERRRLTKLQLNIYVIHIINFCDVKVTGTVENVADVVEKVAGVAEKEYEKLPIHGKLRNSGICWVFRVFLKNNIYLKIY
jgi:hypothetical protein